MPGCSRPRFIDGLCSPCWRLHQAMDSAALEFIREAMAEIDSLSGS